MGISQKDAFTDLAESINSNANSSNSNQQAGSGQVVNSDGDVVTLGQNQSHNKGR